MPTRRELRERLAVAEMQSGFSQQLQEMEKHRGDLVREENRHLNRQINQLTKRLDTLQSELEEVKRRRSYVSLGNRIDEAVTILRGGSPDFPSHTQSRLNEAALYVLTSGAEGRHWEDPREGPTRPTPRKVDRILDPGKFPIRNRLIWEAAKVLYRKRTGMEYDEERRPHSREFPVCLSDATDVFDALGLLPQVEKDLPREIASLRYVTGWYSIEEDR